MRRSLLVGRGLYAGASHEQLFGFRWCRTGHDIAFRLGDAVFSDVQRIVDHFGRDVHPGHIDAVTGIHCIVDLVDQQTAVGIFEKVEGEDTAANGPGCRQAERIELGVTGQLLAAPPRSRVGDPVRRVAVDGADGLVTDDEGTDVTAGFSTYSWM